MDETKHHQVVMLFVLAIVMTLTVGVVKLAYDNKEKDARIDFLERSNQIDTSNLSRELAEYKEEASTFGKMFQDEYVAYGSMSERNSNEMDDFQTAAKKVLLPYVVEEINYEQQKLSNGRDCMESKTEAQCQVDADAYTIEDYRELRDNPPDMPFPPPYETGIQDLGPLDFCPCPPPMSPDPCYPEECPNEPF